MWTSFRGRLSTSLSIPSPTRHKPFSLAFTRQSIFFRSISKQHSSEDYPIHREEEEEELEGGQKNAQSDPLGGGGKPFQFQPRRLGMKWRTASERQRNLER